MRDVGNILDMVVTVFLFLYFIIWMVSDQSVEMFQKAVVFFLLMIAMRVWQMDR